MKFCSSSFAATGTFLAATLCLSSCSLVDLEGNVAGKPLKPGVKYEVRKAIASNKPFKPTEIETRFFVINTSRPPLRAASEPARLTVRTTAYTHDESDHLAYGTKNAIGTNLKFGTVRSAAADWSRYPLGTRFRITGQPGVVYEVDDYGSALVGSDTIDLYKPSQGMMNDWGVRHVNIEVISWGSFEKSRDLIKDRTRYPHVKKMFDELETRLSHIGLPPTKRTPVSRLISGEGSKPARAGDLTVAEL